MGVYSKCIATYLLLHHKTRGQMVPFSSTKHHFRMSCRPVTLKKLCHISKINSIILVGWKEPFGTGMQHTDQFLNNMNFFPNECSGL
jgi:acid phosphatase class B